MSVYRDEVPVALTQPHPEPEISLLRQLIAEQQGGVDLTDSSFEIQLALRLLAVLSVV